MTQIIVLLFSALVALTSYSLVTAAVPLSPRLSDQDVVSVTSASVTSIEATVTEVLTTFFPPNHVATTTSGPQSTGAKWDTTTVTRQPTPTTTLTPGHGPTPQSWTLPATFTDLSPLGIKKLAYGSSNIAVVTGIPASASCTGVTAAAPTPVAPSSSFSAQLPRPWTNTTSAYRLLYPAGSINPGNRPQGGSDFYATPGQLPFRSASNVTLQYSIFFPADFQWVKGGKLPGIYGGHKGCSGGNDAKSCFSTRLMWRRGGAGELYLYAPKDKQTPELCQAPPQSVCDADYGLSVGRGSFHFAAGAWTHISQTVRLNTPGRQDGGFELLVNGQRIMRRDDVFYRDVPSNPDGDDSDGTDNHLGGGVLRRDSQSAFNLGSVGDVDALLRPLVANSGALLGGEVSGKHVPFFAPAAVLSDPGAPQSPKTAAIISTPAIPMTTKGMKANALTATVTSSRFAAPSSVPASQSGAVSQSGAIGFSGLFFSTFFGGHEQSWASPRDQYTWFKDFGMSINE